MPLAFTAALPLGVRHAPSSTASPMRRARSYTPPPSVTRVRAALMDLKEKAAYVTRVREALQEHSQAASSSDAIWTAMQIEAKQAAEEEPLLASFLFSTVLNHQSLPAALAFHLANKLASGTMPSTLLMRLFVDVLSSHEDIRHCVREDLLAVMERDPACTRLIDALLYFKGFHALQAHRISNALWEAGRSPLAHHLQSQVSKRLQVDIHPAARIGPGAFLDHATGIVIGETASIGANCSMLHHVTLGGSGKTHGDRHPKVGDGVLIGAGATILGPVHIGDGVQIGACSLVLTNLPEYATVVGVPARVVSRGKAGIPSRDMKHERCIECMRGVEHTHHVFTNVLN